MKTMEAKRDHGRGKVYLVGGGPGDPGLLTLRGKALLAQADAVVYDKLVGPGVLALIPPETERIFVGKTAGHHPIPQHEINQILLKEALAGKKVVRLKGGDPFVFGRGGEELELLVENNVPFEIVPGVTSAVSVPAYNGIPVTHRDFCSSFHVITGHTKKSDEADVDYETLVRIGGTLIFLMGVTSMPKICRGLMAAGMPRDMPAAVLERGATAHQRRVVSQIGRLTEDAAAAEIRPPAIIVVGKVCTLAQQFHWAEDRPLGGMKIAVTRPRDRSSALADKLADLGAEVVLLPTIETQELTDSAGLEEALRQIGDYSWIAFTSPAGVAAFFQRMKQLSMDIRELAGIRFAAIGEGTARAIEERGIRVDLVPESYSGKALGRLLAERLAAEREEGRPCRLLLPRARIGTEEVTAPLALAGLDFTDLPVYDTVYARGNEAVGWDESVDCVAFTSASTVRGFAKMNPGADLSKVKAVCIGEQTAAQASQYAMEITVAKRATIDSMVECFLARACGQEPVGKPEADSGAEPAGKPEADSGADPAGKPEGDSGADPAGKPEADPGQAPACLQSRKGDALSCGKS